MALTAEKGNRVYTIDETQTDGYIALGYDIYKDGKCIEVGAGRSVTHDEYQKVADENKELKAENKKLKAELKKLKPEGE